MAYRDCGLSFREIGSRVERNQTTVMRICDCWMQEGTTDRRGRSHPPQCTTSLTHLSVTPRWSDSSLETPWREGVEQLRYAPPNWFCTGYYGMGGIGYHSRTPIVRIAGTLNTQHYISEITPPAATPDQLWQRVEATWSAVPQEHIQSLFELMTRRVAAVISNNGGYSGY
ncbi:transposable element Tcb1 transposase [Trichonephila clavipes]|nr:transposable element Tcb1 transposase [Trichonephila clavipes]